MPLPIDDTPTVVEVLTTGGVEDSAKVVETRVTELAVEDSSAVVEVSPPGEMELKELDNSWAELEAGIVVDETLTEGISPPEDVTVFVETTTGRVEETTTPFDTIIVAGEEKLKFPKEL